MRRHVAISGTGRAGTTFLVQLLTELGFDTGFSKSDMQALPERSYGGLEYDIRHPKSPYVIKSPFLCDYFDDVVASADIELEHLIIPVRDLSDAAASRRRVSSLGEASGGLWYTKSFKKGAQESILAAQLYKLLLACSSSHIPVTLLQFPRLATDKDYLFQKLSFLMGPAGISLPSFAAAFDLISKPERIHSFGS